MLQAAVSTSGFALLAVRDCTSENPGWSGPVTPPRSLCARLTFLGTRQLQMSMGVKIPPFWGNEIPPP